MGLRRMFKKAVDRASSILVIDEVAPFPNWAPITHREQRLMDRTALHPLDVFKAD